MLLFLFRCMDLKRASTKTYFILDIMFSPLCTFVNKFESMIMLHLHVWQTKCRCHSNHFKCKIGIIKL